MNRRTDPRELMIMSAMVWASSRGATPEARAKDAFAIAEAIAKVANDKFDAAEREEEAKRAALVKP